MLTGEDYKTFMRLASKAMAQVPLEELEKLTAAASCPWITFGIVAGMGRSSVDTLCIAAAAAMATELERRRQGL